MNTSGALQYSGLYFLIFMLSLLFDAFHIMAPKKKRMYLFVTLGIFMTMSMFRASNVGNDTNDYIALYNQVANQGIPYIKTSITEKGYLLYDYVIALIFNEYQYIFIFSSLFIYISLYHFLMKYCNSPGIFVCMFLGLNMLDFFLSTQRQGIAIAIMLFAIDAAFEKKLGKFILLIVIAIQFHYSSIIFFTVYPLINVNISRKSIKVFLIGATGFCMLFFNRLLSVLLMIFPKYSYYEGGALFDGEPRLAIILKVCVYSLILIVSYLFVNSRNPEYKNKKDDKDVLQFNAFNILSLLNICLFLISSKATALARFCSIFNIYPVTNYSNEMCKTDRKTHCLSVIFTALPFYCYGLIIVLLKTPDWCTTFPFEFTKDFFR